MKFLYTINLLSKFLHDAILYMNETIVGYAKNRRRCDLPLLVRMRPYLCTMRTQDFSKSIITIYIILWRNNIGDRGVVSDANAFYFHYDYYFLHCAWAYEPTGWARAGLAGVAEIQSRGGEIQNVRLDRVRLYMALSVVG